MRKFLLSLLLLVVFSPLALRADEVIVGTADGTAATVVVPFRNNMSASYTQSVYSKEEVGGAMTITAVAFNCATPTETTSSNVKIYIGETDLTYFENSGNWLTDDQGRTLVYEGAVTLGGEEWENFTFSKAYNYSGTKNLVIAVSADGTVTNDGLKWNVVTPSSTKPSLHNTQANAEPSGIATVKSYRPIIKLTVVGEGGDNTDQPVEPEYPETEFPVSFYDNFDDAKYTDRWNCIDANGDSYNWGSLQDGMFGGYEETNGLYSASFLSGNPLYPDNYVYRNTKYSITETSALSFLHRESDSEKYEENFGVVISEDGVNFEVVWSKRYTAEDLHEDGVWGYDSIPLAAYAGKNVYVGFRHYDCNGNTANGIRIENVRLSTAYSNGEDEEEEEGPEIPIEGDAVTVVIGEDGNLSSYYVPMDERSILGVSQQIYTAEEIGTKEGTIVSISFKSDVAGNQERKLAVYLTNTDKEYYEVTEDKSYDWVLLTSEDVAVYEGFVVTPATSDWFTIYFTRPFEYTGGNLAVTVNDLSSEYTYAADTWCSYSTENPRSIYSISYSEDIDLLSLDTRFGSLNKTDNGQYINSQVKFGIIQTPASVRTPETIAFGDVVLGEYWTERATVKANVKAVNTTITSITVDNNFFVLPAEIDCAAESIELEVSYDRNASAGEYTGNLVISYADTTVFVPMTANAYAAATPDVFELAQEVTFTEDAFEHTPVFANLHDSYLLPQEYEDGNAPDAVYEVEFDEDALVTASVTGTKAKLAVYKSNFNGEGGPSANNYYDGILYTPRNFNFDFSDGTLNGWTLIDNDGDGYNWIVEEKDGNKYVRSYGEKKQGEGEQEVTIVTKADNVMMTEQAYNITANSKLSFDAARLGNESYNDSETYKQYIRVEVSKDGEAFTMIEKVLPNPSTLAKVVVDLGAKFAELGLNYGDYYIALHHKENGMWVSVDNIRLANIMTSRTEAKTIEDIHFPAGKYYFIAAAESEFSVSISKKDVPLTPPVDIYATDITETSVVLSWNKIAKAESYNIYNGETLLGNTADTTYSVTGLTPFTEYSFVIKSVAGEEESFASAVVVVKTNDLPLGSPSNLVAEATGTSSIKLTWNAAENALSYNVYMYNDEDAERIATVEGLTYTVTNLDANTVYFFTVTAVRNEQESEHTDKVYAITADLIPGAPSNLKANPIDASSIGLSWDAGENATGYNIYRDGVKVGDATGLSYVDKDLVAGTEYCYIVKGVRGVVESEGSSNQVCATTFGTKPTPPVAPTNLIAAEIDSTSIKLVWSAVGNAVSYNVYQDTVVIATVELPTYTVDSLMPETEYCFTVTAVNPVGESEKSVEVCATTASADAIEELTSSFNIYPNPVSDKLYIETLTQTQTLTVVVYNMFGRQQSMVNGQQSTIIDVTNLNSGVYFVKVVTENGETVKRFIKK